MDSTRPTGLPCRTQCRMLVLHLLVGVQDVYRPVFRAEPRPSGGCWASQEAASPDRCRQPAPPHRASTTSMGFTVPNLRDDLPLIDQPWFWTFQELSGQQPGLGPCLLILLERGLAASMVSPGPRLAACLCPLDYHYRCALQGFSNLLVSDPLDISARGQCGRHIAGCSICNNNNAIDISPIIYLL